MATYLWSSLSNNQFIGAFDPNADVLRFDDVTISAAGVFAVANAPYTEVIFSYGGKTPQFWGSLEATAGPEEFRAFGMPCGKGEPKQWGFLGHGASPSLFRGILTGVAR